MTVVKVFFSFEGRISRATWWLLSFAMMALNIIIAAVLNKLLPPVGYPGQSLSMGESIAALLQMWPVLAIGAKRLHDRNKSGWWLAAFMAPAVLLIIVSMMVLADPMSASGLIGMLSFLFIATLIAIVWNVVELGFLKGDDTANDYGHPWRLSDVLNGGESDAGGAACAGTELAPQAASISATRAVQSAAKHAAPASPAKSRTAKPASFGRRPAHAR